MIEIKDYFPAITIREGECKAVAELAGATRDKIFPIVKVQAWPRAKADEGDPIERSLSKFGRAFGDRPFAIDLAAPRTDLETEWALQGRRLLGSLHDPATGFIQWRRLVASDPRYVPTLQWCDDAAVLHLQASEMESLGRGVVLRLRRSNHWDLIGLSLVGQVLTGNILVILDFGQLSSREDLTLVGLDGQNALNAARSLLPRANLTFCMIGSSFPSAFAVIDEEHAFIEMAERTLHGMLATSPQIRQAGIELHYGDYASVFAGDRDPAFRGAPRVDYPLPRGWIYHRCKEGFDVAVARVRNDHRWNEELLCWGAQRIRTAAGGNMSGLNAATPWAAVRINIHLHLQAHANDTPFHPIEEPWSD